MKAMSLGLFAVASAILTAVGFSTGPVIVGIIGTTVGLVTTFFVVKRNTLALSFALCVYVFLAFCLTFLHQTPIAMLFVVIAALLGWDAALTEKDISAFPKEERRRFTLRHFLLTLVIVSCSLGITLPARLFRLRLSFSLTLSVALAAIFLLGSLLHTLHPPGKRRNHRRMDT